MVLLIRLVFIALIPLGIFLLVKAIRLVQSSFFGPLVAEVPLDAPLRLVDLALAEPGLYAVWLRGRRAQVYALSSKLFRPTVWENTTRKLVPLRATFGRTQASDSDGFRQKFYTFEVPAGRYTLDLAGVPLASADGLVVQVRKTKPAYYGVAGILLCIISGFLLIGGTVLAILAGEIMGTQP